ncbi:hypothetical protein QE152_g7907 [Popillia japonica]|uniref:Uncharacterized protein n=1 Tax=Popillia japonica TaxID=7064 RepID=A0AAW1MDQ0_POPJA
MLNIWASILIGIALCKTAKKAGRNILANIDGQNSANPTYNRAKIADWEERREKWWAVTEECVNEIGQIFNSTEMMVDPIAAEEPWTRMCTVRNWPNFQLHRDDGGPHSSRGTMDQNVYCNLSNNRNQ